MDVSFRTRRTAWRRAWPLFTLLALLGGVTGCNSFLSTVMYWNKGAVVAAEFPGLEQKRVAVVCVANSASYGSGSEGDLLARNVGLLLKQHVQEIELVRPDEIADWIDRHGWDQLDYREVGKGVKADLVLAIDLEGMSLYEGQTLYKGQANLTVTVLDMAAGGHEVFRRSLSELKFPQHGAYPTTDTSEVKFRRAFLAMLAKHAAKYFYDYDIAEDFGNDPVLLDQ